MTPQKVNQGRFLLGWSHEQLAWKSRVPAFTIAEYEAGGDIPPAQLAALHRTLTAAGIDFAHGECVLQRLELPDTLTPAQCQAARNALGWPQHRLAQKAGIPKAAITAFERSGVMSSARNQSAKARVERLRTVFQQAGLCLDSTARQSGQRG